VRRVCEEGEDGVKRSTKKRVQRLAWRDAKTNPTGAAKVLAAIRTKRIRREPQTRLYADTLGAALRNVAAFPR
jgi:hypothetical protein